MLPAPSSRLRALSQRLALGHEVRIGVLPAYPPMLPRNMHCADEREPSNHPRDGCDADANRPQDDKKETIAASSA
jgi:hypothetical protein